MIALGNFGPAGAAGAAKPADQEGGPSLETYDAAQRDLAQAEVAGIDPGDRREKEEFYTVRLEVDLAALGLADTAQGWDVELKAGRTKIENPVSLKVPNLPDIGILAGDDGLDLDVEHEARFRAC